MNQGKSPAPLTGGGRAFEGVLADTKEPKPRTGGRQSKIGVQAARRSARIDGLECQGEPIATFRKNAREVVQVRFGSCRGHRVVDARVFVRIRDGTYVATRKGICLRREHVTTLLDALAKAQAVIENDSRPTDAGTST